MAIRKCVALAGSVSTSPSNDYRQPPVRYHYAATGTKWIRFFAFWHYAHPGSMYYDPNYIAALDANIRQARADGLKVMLTSAGLPTPAVAGQTGKGAPETAQVQAPLDVTINSPWGQWIAFLINRYGRYGSQRVDDNTWVEFLEICNEPNYQMWPQQDNSGIQIMACKVATMMQTSRTIRATAANNQILLAGPALADGRGPSDEHHTNIYDFVGNLLPQLNIIGWQPDIAFAWSQHSYSDCQYPRLALPADQYDTRPDVNRGQLVRRQLAAWGNWSGWPSGNTASPSMLLTEGCARIGATEGGIVDDQVQNTRIANWLGYIYNSAIGDGIGMVTNYQFITSSGFDSGLVKNNGPEPTKSGDARPAYSTWAYYPSQ